MHARTRLAALVLVSTPLFPTTLAPGGGTEKDFEEGLALVDRTIAAGRAKKAKELLLAALTEHHEERWVLYHLTEIKDALRRSTFWSTNEKPDPKGNISGELVSYSAASGQIKLRYAADVKRTRFVAGSAEKRPPVLADFQKGASFELHPLMFDGPFTIEIEGTSHPALSSEEPPNVLVCADLNENFQIVFGLPRSDSGTKSTWLPARIFHRSDGAVFEVDEKETPAVAGQPYAFKVVVGTGAISAYVDDRKLLEAKKSPSTWGQFGFANMRGLSRITISGKVTPTWIQGVVDAAVQKRWSEFETRYKPEDDLPAGLREKAAAPSSAEPDYKDVCPGTDHQKRAEHWKAIEERLGDKQPEGALEYVQKISADDVTEALRAWMTALVCQALGRGDEAMQACDKVTALDPKFLPARRLRVWIEFSFATRAQAIASCFAMIDDFADEPGPRADLVELLLLEGRPDEARAVLHTAIDAGISPGALEESDHLLARATKGPLWGRPYEYKSEHYVVTSDLSQQLCFQAANILEKFYDKYNIHLRRIADKQKKVFRVHLFSGEAGYLAYAKDLTGLERKNTLGLYSPLVKQLLIWNQPDTDAMLRTVRHEGFHQYFDRLLDASPVWLNEGMAEYYELSKLAGGKWSDGEIHHGHLATLAKEGILPLETFLPIGPNGFYHEKLVQLTYAQAWAFVHFLIDGGNEPRRRFDRLLDALIGGAKPKDALAQAFPAADLPKLQEQFQAYLATLR